MKVRRGEEAIKDEKRGTTSPPPVDMVRRILVTAYGHTADTLSAGPSLAALRSAYPDARLDILVVEQIADLWQACPYVDVVRVMRDFKRKGTRLARLEQLWYLARLTLRLRGRYDLVVV